MDAFAHAEQTEAGTAAGEGGGCVEAAPVVAVNHPDRNRPGSVGQLLPGMEARLDAPMAWTLIVGSAVGIGSHTAWRLRKALGTEPVEKS